MRDLGGKGSSGIYRGAYPQIYRLGCDGPRPWHSEASGYSTTVTRRSTVLGATWKYSPKVMHSSGTYPTVQSPRTQSSCCNCLGRSLFLASHRLIHPWTVSKALPPTLPSFSFLRLEILQLFSWQHDRLNLAIAGKPGKDSDAAALTR